MATSRVIRFGRYLLDPIQGLKRGSREVRVTPKSLDVLRLLAERSGQVVTKTELFQTIWSDAAVSDAALTSCIQELRNALEDDARRPRVIETIHRRGFRFLVQTRVATTMARADGTDDGGLESIVGRAAALATLSAVLDRARRGTRQVVVVTGEAGIGKTSLVEAFIRSLAGEPELHAVRADCAERYSAGEAYQPLLEALTRLCRRPGGDRILVAMRKYAPTWLAQIPAVHSPSELRALQRRTAGVTRERMLRELNDCLEADTLGATLALWIDDLHWSDASTLDWLASFAQRPEPARVLVIATCRRGTSEAVDDLAIALGLKRQCVEIALTGLDENAAIELVAQRVRELDEASARDLAHTLHAHTEGHPLFMSLLLDDLRGRGVLTDMRVQGGAAAASATTGRGIPDTLRRLIERQFDELAPDERSLLEVASVLGGEWSAATIAAGAERALDDVESSLLAVARRSSCVRHAGTSDWPDGTVAERFAFVHTLHRDVLHDRLTVRRRAELHRLVGERLESAFGPGAIDLAAQLAVHFEEARDVAKAVAYLQHAGRIASRRGAAEEARRHLQRALAVLEGTPPSAARDEREVDLQILLGGVMMALQGWGAAEVQRTFDRARDLCARIAASPQLFPALWGLWMFRWGRGDLSAAREVAATLEQLALAGDDRDRRLQMHHALWATSFSMGDLDAVRSHADQGLAIYDAAQHADQASLYGNHDAGVCSRIFAARALAMQGHLSDAVRVSDNAIEDARRLDHPFTVALALVFAAAVHHLRRDPLTTARHAGEAALIGSQYGFRLMRAWATALDAWAATESRSERTAPPLLAEAVASALATGSLQFRTFLLGLLAESYLKTGDSASGLVAIEAARAAVEDTGERFYEAEIHRLYGELLLSAGSADRDTAKAGRALRRALDTAHRQHAHLFALRASVSLGRLWQQQGRRAEARDLVAVASRRVPADVVSPDTADADALLAEISAEPRRARQRER
jgi:DNA-binding winged helix-turn-helix (wHTH) protein/predicted ATPase